MAILEVVDLQAANSPREVLVVLRVVNGLQVPGDYPTIQSAIDAAADRDIVEIADGTYTGAGNRDLNFGGKAITVRSTTGEPALCIIDCEGDGRGFSFSSGEGPLSVVEGLTIANGNASEGGGVLCDANSSPTLTNCTIRDNVANERGGGVCCTDQSSPALTNCTIRGNAARSRYGDGGGVHCGNSEPTLVNCTIIGNLAKDQGGGIYYNGGHNPTMINCRLSGNRATFGGGLSCSLPPFSVLTLTNCTIDANRAYEHGGGVYCPYEAPVLTNCILWGNEPEAVHGEGAVMNHCDVQGGWDGTGNIDVDPLFAFAGEFHLMPGSPCIDAGTNDPAGGLPPDDLGGTVRPVDGDGDAVAIADMGADEFDPAAPRIALSPVTLEFVGIEGADNLTVRTLSVRNCGGEVLNWEITGQPTWLTAVPSSGESSGEVDLVTLSIDTTGLADGTYFAVLDIADVQAIALPREVDVTLHVVSVLHVPDEYATIQAAIDAAGHRDIVEIADGTYTGAGNKDLDFGGKAITVRGESGNPALCIIDCEGDGRGFDFHNDEGPESVVAGLTIGNGSAPSGGGINCYDFCSPTLINCKLGGNSATGSYVNNHAYGGGVHCNVHSSPTLTNCMIIGNSATSNYHSGVGYGGGVSCFNYSCPTLANCVIYGNTADDDSGGIFCSADSAVSLVDCIMWGDSPNEIGGTSDTLVVTYCDIQGGTGESWFGVGCIDADPLFFDPDGRDSDPDTWEDNDFRLSAGSPCIDAGDNDALPADAFDLDGDGDVDELLPIDLLGHDRRVDDPVTTDTGNPGAAGPPVVDMGAYEYVLPGDVNCDGDIDVDDINVFVLALHGREAYEAAYPDCNWMNADCNNDGLVDFDDIDAFVVLLSGG